jgi:hypothetical protein
MIRRGGTIDSPNDGTGIRRVELVELVEPESAVVDQRWVGRGPGWGLRYPTKWYGKVDP